MKREGQIKNVGYNFIELKLSDYSDRCIVYGGKVSHPVIATSFESFKEAFAFFKKVVLFCEEKGTPDYLSKEEAVSLSL